MKRIKEFIKKYKTASDNDKEYYQGVIEKIILIISAAAIPIVLYFICRQW